MVRHRRRRNLSLSSRRRAVGAPVGYGSSRRAADALPSRGNRKWERRAFGGRRTEIVCDAAASGLRAAAGEKLFPDLWPRTRRGRAVRSRPPLGRETYGRRSGGAVGPGGSERRLGRSAAVDRDARHFSVASAAGGGDAAGVCGGAFVAEVGSGTESVSFGAFYVSQKRRGGSETRPYSTSQAFLRFEFPKNSLFVSRP